MDDTVLHAAPSLGRDALSGRLERALVTLAAETGPSVSWRRAWLLTAVGRYGEALEQCGAAMEGPGLLQASAKMVEAMVYRQVALHHLAEEADDAALQILTDHRIRSKAVRAAIRVGQVADAVGVGAEDPVLARRLKVAAAAVTTSGSWRQQVRMMWVRGEVAMVRERYAQAGRAFGSGTKIAASQGARRHEAKSLIFLAAASAAREQPAEAKLLATRGLQLAARCGAPPLMWPAELILAEVDPANAAAHLERARRVAGGLLDTLPQSLRDAALQRPPAQWLLGLDIIAAGAAPPATGPLDRETSRGATVLPTDA